MSKLKTTCDALKPSLHCD